MVNIIYKILIANDSEQHKYNNDNAIKYLESNKYNIIDLEEKHYENLVEALTNNAIDNASSSSNPDLNCHSHRLHSSQSNQSNIYNIEDSKSFHHSKGDIAE